MIINRALNTVLNASTKIDSKSDGFLHGLLFFLFLVFLFIFSLGQLTNVYIRHDDWEFMTHLAPQMEGFVSPWDKTLLEGRWVNYLWSFIAYNLPAKMVYCLFILGYALFCWLSAFFISNNSKITFVVAVALFLCPAYADLSFWPATLSPSVWIAIVLLAIFIKKNEITPLFIVISAVLMLTYQPLIPACFLLFTLRLNSVGATFKVGLYYYLGYITGVLAIYLLNYHYHNFLGVKIADWRNPNPVQSLQDVVINFKKSMHTWHLVFSYYSWVTISSIAGIVVIAYFNKMIFIRLFVAVAMIFFFETLMQTYTGVDIPARSLIWPWVLFICIITMLFNFYSPLSRTRGRNISIATASVMLISCLHLGGVNWIGFYNYENYFAQYEDYLGNYLRGQPNEQVFACGDFNKTQGYKNHDFKELALAIWKKHAINLTPLNSYECSKLNLPVGLSVLNDRSYYRVN